MKKPRVRNRKNWDHFHLQVQEFLVEPLGLENVVIKVNRHQGKNGNVGVKFPTLADSPPKDVIHDDRVMDRKQLTVDQLRQEIKTILDSLLENCVVEYGRIRIEVHQGELTELLFSFSTKPHESTANFFCQC